VLNEIYIGISSESNSAALRVVLSRVEWLNTDTGFDSTFDLKKTTHVAAPSPRASLGRRTVCGRTEQHWTPAWKRYETKVRIVLGSFLIAAAALKTPTRKGYTAQGVTLTFYPPRGRAKGGISIYVCMGVHVYVCDTLL